MKVLRVGLGVAGWMFAGSALMLGQDTRTVTEPVFPAVCAVLASQTAIVGGQPASETMLDTTRLQAALNACTSGQAVELSASGGNYAFLIAPITIPSGVSLIVDGGVTVFASRNPADYQTSSTELCGTYGSSGNGCNNLLNFTKNGTGSGIYGYGVIDGRGGSTMLTGANAGLSWWTNADNANTAGKSQDNPILMKPTTNNLTLYKVTFRNSPMFHIGWAGTGFTAWGIKIQAPFAAHNTDGIDPDGTNITITNSSISDGDDNVAVGASSAAANVTISNVTTYSGHGISVGSYTQGGLTNMLVSNVNMAGTAQDTNATGIRLKSAEDRGGLIQNVTYQNMCVKDIHHILEFNPFYNSNTGTLYPQFKNITMSNVHFLTPTTNQYPYLVQMQGFNVTYPASVTMNNVVFDQLLAGNVTPAPEYISFALAGNVYPAFLQTLSGTDVSYTGSATSSPTIGALSCPATVFPYIVGELYLSGSNSAQQYTQSLAGPATVSLNAMVQPAMTQTAFSGTAGNWTGAPALTNSIQFYEGSSLVGTAPLGANGSLATLTLMGVAAGTHTYTAQYPADANYAALNFGSVTVTVTIGSAVASTTTLTVPSSSVVYGSAEVLSVKVAPVSGTTVPTGTVQILDGATVVGTATLSGGSATASVVLAGGSHSLTASYLGDTNDLASTSAASAVTVTTATPAIALTASPTTVIALNSTALTAKLTAVTNGVTPTGTVTFYNGAAVAGTASLVAGTATLSVPMTSVGAQSLTATYSGDTNYATVTSAAAQVTVTGLATVTTLTVSPTGTTSYVGASLTLTALTGSLTGVPTGMVTFSNGSTVLGTGTLNGSGIATLAVTLSAAGTESITASYAGGGVYLASASSAAALSVVQPLTLANGTASSTLAAGAMATDSVTVTPAGGFTGTVSFTCSSPVTYVTCTMSPASQVVTGTTAVSTVATITVAATIAESGRQVGRGWYALLLPLGALGLMRRRRLGGILLLMVLAGGALGMTGCGGSSGASAGGSGIKLPPAGTVSVTIVATTPGASVSTAVQVTVSN